jgi:hypothetical protein
VRRRRLMCCAPDFRIPYIAPNRYQFIPGHMSKDRLKKLHSTAACQTVRCLCNPPSVFDKSSSRHSCVGRETHECAEHSFQ